MRTRGAQGASGFDFIYGAGGQLFVTRNLGLRVEFEYVPKLGNNDTGEADVWMVSGGPLWRF